MNKTVSVDIHIPTLEQQDEASNERVLKLIGLLTLLGTSLAIPAALCGKEIFQILASGQ